MLLFVHGIRLTKNGYEDKFDCNTQSLSKAFIRLKPAMVHMTYSMTSGTASSKARIFG